MAAVLTVGTLLIFFASGSHEYIYGLIFPQPDFKISANPEFLILQRYEGSMNSTTIILASINNFNGNIALRVVMGFGIIGNVKSKLTFHNVYLPAGGETQVSLTLYVHSNIAPGNWYVDIIGSSGKIKHSVRISINAPA